MNENRKERIVLQADVIDQLHDSRVVEIIEKYNTSKMVCGYFSLAFAWCLRSRLKFTERVESLSSILQEIAQSEEFISKLIETVELIAEQRIRYEEKNEEDGSSPPVGIYEISELLRENNNKNNSSHHYHYSSSSFQGLAFVRQVWRLPGTEEMWNDLNAREVQCLDEEKPFVDLDPPVFVEVGTEDCRSLFMSVKDWLSICVPPMVGIIDYKGHYVCFCLTNLSISELKAWPWRASPSSVDIPNLIDDKLNDGDVMIPCLIIINSLLKWNSLQKEIISPMSQLH